MSSELYEEGFRILDFSDAYMAEGEAARCARDITHRLGESKECLTEVDSWFGISEDPIYTTARNLSPNQPGVRKDGTSVVYNTQLFDGTEVESVVRAYFSSEVPGGENDPRIEEDIDQILGRSDRL